MSASVETHNEVSTGIINKTAVEAKIDTTTEASASVGTSNDYASVEVGVSVKTGTEAEVKAGLIDNNVVVEASYSDTTEAHVTASASVGAEGVGVGASADAYAKSGNEANINMSVGENGVSAGAEASVGSCVGVDGEVTVGLREASGTVGGGVSVGENLSIGGNGEATFKDGVATVGVSGDVAALVGLEVDVSVKVDTNQIVSDGKVVVKESEKIVNTVVPVVNDVGHKTKKEVDNIGKKIKKGLHF
jgi:hypothetical protein